MARQRIVPDMALLREGCQRSRRRAPVERYVVNERRFACEGPAEAVDLQSLRAGPSAVSLTPHKIACS